MNRITILFFVLIILSSCTVYKEYPIDIYKPGPAAIPAETKYIALVYRNFKFTNDTLQHYYTLDKALQKAKGDPKNLDSLLAIYCLNELATNLKKHNQNIEIHIFPELFKPHSGKKMPVLDVNLVDQLAEKVDADLIISLETHSYFYNEYTEQSAPNSREVVTADVWSVYNPLTRKITDHKTMIDTIFWNPYDEAGKLVKNTKLPPRLTALKIASQMAGENYSKRFFASWENVKRTYSIPPLADFESAEKYLIKGDWDSAIMLWKRYAADKNGKMAINARYNLALGYEMKDDMESALQWITSAKQIAESYKSRDNIKMIDKYQKILVQRQKDIERLNGM